MKYVVTKADGSPVDPSARYFVLRVDDLTRPDCKAARAALMEYAMRACDQDPAAAMAAHELLEEVLCGGEVMQGAPAVGDECKPDSGRLYEYVNVFHRTSVKSRKSPEEIEEIRYRLANGKATPADKVFARHMRSALCGANGCTCGDEFGRRT